MSRIRSGIREIRNRFITWLDKDTGLPRAGGYFPASSGVVVTEESAMRVTAVFACVRILSWTLASLPLHVYRRLETRGKERATSHPLYRLLHSRPNPEQTSFQFCALLGAHECLWGNGYAEIEFDLHGQIVAMWPIPAWRCTPRRTAEKNELFYEVNLPDGTLKKLAAYRVFHVRGLSINGDEGLSPIGMAREAIGLSVAAEKFGASFFGNGLNAGGVIEHPKSLSKELHQRLKEDLNEKHEGLGKAHRLMFLEEGMKYVKVGINPDEAQFLDTRKFQVADIARLYGIPPHMIGDTEKSTSWGTGIEQQSIGFVVHTMRPYLVAWEQEMALKLLDSSEQETYYAKFSVDGLLRGDTASRYRAYATGRQWGWLSVNDIRELEDMNPIDGGDIYVQPLNMQDVALPLENEPEGKPSSDSIDDQPDPQDTDTALLDGFIAEIDAYGTAVRAGVITPQPEDEDHFRGKAKLPTMTEAVRGDWKKNGGIRRPVTLASPTDTKPAPSGADVSGVDSLARKLAPVFIDAASRILRREEADVMRMARKLAPDALRNWLPGFYQEHKGYISRQLGPVASVTGSSEQLEGVAELISEERQFEMDGLVVAGAEAMQAHFDNTREDRAAQICGLMTGGQS